MITLDDVLPPPPSELPDGWAGWVPAETLVMPTARGAKCRPWCRGRARATELEWFPRTSKLPWEGTRYAVFSPEGQLPGLRKPGWFVANAYVRTVAEFDPAGEPLGTIPADVMASLYACLENVFWDEYRRLS